MAAAALKIVSMPDSFTYIPGPQIQASTDWHNFKAKLQPNNGKWMDGCRMLSILKRSLLLSVVL